MRVLIVEDDPTSGALLTQLVRRLWPPASVVLEANALSGIAAWQRAGADLVLLDWELPGMSGIEVLKQIRRSGQPVRCVMISGHADREVILAARQYRIDAYIVKPFNATQLMDRLSQIVALPEEALPTDVEFDSLDAFIAFYLTEGTLALPIDPDLVSAIQGIRELDAEERTRLLRRCQIETALVFRLLTLANSSHYLHGLEAIETFEVALQRVGLDGVINLAIEISLYPGSTLEQDFLKARCLEYRRDSVSVMNILSKLASYVPFDVKAARAACMLYRVGELALLQLMQAWLDRGRHLTESECAALIEMNAARAAERIQIQWKLPNAIHERVSAVHVPPVGTVRKDPVVMRIATLLHAGDPEQELPRLLPRVGLAADPAVGFPSIKSTN